jgi:hypothetical protein
MIGLEQKFWKGLLALGMLHKSWVQTLLSEQLALLTQAGTGHAVNWNAETFPVVVLQE